MWTFGDTRLSEFTSVFSYVITQSKYGKNLPNIKDRKSKKEARKWTSEPTTASKQMCYETASLEI